MNKYYVYMYLDQANVPFYIGKGSEDRFKIRAHLVQNHNHLLKNKIRKVGVNNIKIHFLHENITEEESFSWERYWIKYIGRRDKGEGPLCNLTGGGEGTTGHVCSEETKQKISKANRGKHNILGYWLGRERPEETKYKISKTKLGTPAWNKGISMSEKQKEKISGTKLGTPAWNKGIPCTEETKQKISKTLVGHEPSEEARRNMREAQKARREQEKLDKGVING